MVQLSGFKLLIQDVNWQPELPPYMCGLLSSSLMNCQRWMFDLPTRAGADDVIIGCEVRQGEKGGSEPEVDKP